MQLKGGEIYFDSWFQCIADWFKVKNKMPEEYGRGKSTQPRTGRKRIERKQVREGWS